VIAHTVFDRSLLRAGETLNMKHILRRHTRDGFAIPAAETRPGAVSIRHAGSGQAYEMPLAWDAAGVAETEWSIPRDAQLGNYTVTLVAQSGSEVAPPVSEPAGAEAPEEAPRAMEEGRSLTSGRFRVEEFRVPLLKGVIQPPSQPLIDVGAAPLDLSVQYLSGGGVGLLPVKLRTEVSAKPIPAIEGFEDFIFGNGSVREGLVRRGSRRRSVKGGRRRTPVEAHGRGRGSGFIRRRARGGARSSARRRPAGDDRGIGVPGPQRRGSNRLRPHPSVECGLPGRHQTGRLGVSKDDLRLQAAVVDLSGEPVAGAPVRIDAFERRVISHRKRLVGGFYGYDHTVEIKRLATLAEGRTDAKGLMRCETRAPLSGEVLLVAESRDAAGRRTFAHRSVWVAGRNDWWFEVADHDRMDLIPSASATSRRNRRFFRCACRSGKPRP